MAERYVVFKLIAVTTCFLYMAAGAGSENAEAGTKTQLAIAKCKYRFGKRFIGVSLWKDGKTFTCYLKKQKERAVAVVFSLTSH
jgi:hypothetical protein